MHIGPDTIEEKIHEIGSLDIGDIDEVDTKNTIFKIKDDSREVLEKYKIFGNPDEEQRKILDNMSENLRTKLEGKLFFREKTTEIIIPSGKKLIFDKRQLFLEPTDWETAMNNVNFGQRLLTTEEFKGLFNLFKIGKEYHKDELLNLFGIFENTIYWTSDVSWLTSVAVCYDVFPYGYIGNYSKIHNFSVIYTYKY